MKLPYDLLSETYTKPRVFLCETDKTIVCQLDVYDFKGHFKFNALSEISCTVDRRYDDFFSGELEVNPAYDKIEALRLLFIEGFGYFEIQGPKITSDGIQESKSITAYSLEYTLSQKYLTNFSINTGEVGAVEVTYAEDHGSSVIPVTLYNPENPQLSLLHLVLEKAYGWSIGYVDPQIANLNRTFDIDRKSVYDFIINEICDKFNCYVVFDSIHNTFSFYAETSMLRLAGDGTSNQVALYPKPDDIESVAIDGYKTTQWKYDATTGVIGFTETPRRGAIIEIFNNGLQKWETDVLVSFENLSDQMNISYDADDIKTVLYITYGEDLDVREINLGLPYIVDLSYYYSVDWMGQDLYDAYTDYSTKCNNARPTYMQNSKLLQDYMGYIDFAQNRLSLGYSVSQVSSTTTGKYYIRGGSAPQYYYTEVNLPTDYNINNTYYKMNLSNLSEEKVNNLYNVLKEYFMAESHAELEELWRQDYDLLDKEFAFVQTELSDLKQVLLSVAHGRVNSTTVSDAIVTFLELMWNEVGKTPLQTLYYETYKQIQVTNIEMGWSEVVNPNYPNYYPVTIFLKSIEQAIKEREITIQNYQKQYDKVQTENAQITESLLLDKNFTPQQLIRLNAFFREDEVKYDNIVHTDIDSLVDTFRNQEHALELARIELHKIAEPKLEFSATMGNIYAIKDFEPIIHQFQLGNLIKIRLRDNYLKQARLLQVDINFEDFSDFSCQFGDLTSLKSQSDIHADLLANAISAGKQVASNANNWNKNTERLDSFESNLQQGLLDTVSALKSSNTNQSSYMDKYGFHLEATDNDTGKVSPKKVWLVNDKIVFTDDDFKTSKSVIGEYTINGETRWGLLAEYVNAGLIEGCQMIGGTIKIGAQPDGSYAFEVKPDGSVVMNGGGTVDGFVTEEKLESTAKDLQTKIDKINARDLYNVEILSEGSTIISTPEDKTIVSCRVLLWGADITDKLDSSLFKWKRKSTDENRDIIWNSMPEHQNVKQVTITADDVIENSSFSCEVNLPD